MYKCVCGHLESDHRKHPTSGYMLCVALKGAHFADDCLEFKLDNLQLVEDLAKEKGLIS